MWERFQDSQAYKQYWNGENRHSLIHWQWDGTLTGSLGEAMQQWPSKLKVHMPLDPGVPIPGVYSKEILTQVQKHLQCSIAWNSEKLETT